jgi:hypothetical protein
MPAADASERAAMPRAAMPPARPEGEPHLTFEMLLADTLHEMAVHEDEPAAAPDAVDRLRDHTLSALRLDGSAPSVRPFHHAYLTPAASAVVPSHPPRLDVRS